MNKLIRILCEILINLHMKKEVTIMIIVTIIFIFAMFIL